MRLIGLTLRWLQGCALLLGLVAAGWLSMRMVFNLQLLSVQTGSMQPAFRPGDVLVIRRSPARPQVGQVITYHSPRNGGELISHRVVAVYPLAQSFQTQGDALAEPDPVVRDSLAVGYSLAVIPELGTIIDRLRTIPGLIACVYIPALLVAFGELQRLERTYARFRPYRMAG